MTKDKNRTRAGQEQDKSRTRTGQEQDKSRTRTGQEQVKNKTRTKAKQDKTNQGNIIILIIMQEKTRDIRSANDHFSRQRKGKLYTKYSKTREDLRTRHSGNVNSPSSHFLGLKRMKGD